MDDADRREKENPRPALIHLNLYLTRQTVLWSSAAIIACAAVYGAFSDTLTMTAYYPSPYGAYYQLLATNNGMFARDKGSVSIGGDSAGKRNTATGGNVLTVYGNAAVVNNPNNATSPTLSIGTSNDGTLSVSGNVNATGKGMFRGVTLGDGGATPTAGTLGWRGGSVQYFDGSGWQNLGGASSVPPGTISTFPGTTCPSGYTFVQYYFPSMTCAAGSGCGGVCGLACATPSQFSTTAPSCIYGPDGCHCAVRTTCTASATQVQCQKN